MFCHKCGSQIANDSSFCQKCGAKMVSADTAPQTLGTHVTQNEPVKACIDNKTTPPYTPNLQVDTLKKKKSMKLPYILGAVALVKTIIRKLNQRILWFSWQTRQRMLRNSTPILRC